jgi:hypothetical protein
MGDGMEKITNTASIITVVALLITIQYSSDPSDLWDIVLVLIAGMVFWTTRNEWYKDKIIRGIISVGVGTSIAIVYSAFRQGYKLVCNQGVSGLFQPQQLSQTSTFIDYEIIIAVISAMVFFIFITWNKRS